MWDIKPQLWEILTILRHEVEIWERHNNLKLQSQYIKPKQWENKVRSWNYEKKCCNCEV